MDGGGAKSNVKDNVLFAKSTTFLTIFSWKQVISNNSILQIVTIQQTHNCSCSQIFALQNRQYNNILTRVVSLITIYSIKQPIKKNGILRKSTKFSQIK